MKIRQRAFVVFAALACLMFALCGCASNDYQPELKSPEVAPPAIAEEGVLRVGVNTENPPLAGMGSGKIIGIDVDIAAAIADELGLKISIVDVGSDPASAILENKVDIVMGIDDSNESNDYWLSESYMPTGIAAFAMNVDAGLPTAKSKFAAQVSSKSAWAVGNEFGQKALTSTDTLSDAFAELEADKVNFVAADAIIGLYAAHGQGMQVTLNAMLMKPSGYAVAVANDNAELREAAGAALKKLVENGTIDIIERKWLGQDIALDTLAVVGEEGSAAAAYVDEMLSEKDKSSESAEKTDEGAADDGNEESADESANNETEEDVQESTEDTSEDEE